MGVFPVTYVAVLIWLVLATYESINTELKLSVRFMGIIFGIATAILSLGGEKWVSVNNSGTFSVSTFNSGFALPLGLTMIGISLVMMFITIFAWIDKDKEKS